MVTFEPHGIFWGPQVMVDIGLGHLAALVPRPHGNVSDDLTAGFLTGEKNVTKAPFVHVWEGHVC